MNENLQMNKAIDLLDSWVRKINLSSAIDFYDINKVAENLAANLLNEIYDYKMSNLNPEQHNFPAVDLGCDVKKIAFQITSIKEPKSVKKKIKSTLEKFVSHKLQDRFVNGVRFLFLTTDKAIKLTDDNRKKYQSIYSGFDENHLLTVQNLIQKIQILYNKDNEKFCRILKILERELSPQSADNTAEIVRIVIEKYNRESQIKDEQIKSLTESVANFSKREGISGTDAEIKEAEISLNRGDTFGAYNLFIKGAENYLKQANEASLKAAKAFRNAGALAFLDNTQEALNAYRRATELDPDNADGWNEFGYLLRRIGVLDQAIVAYQKVLALGKIHQNPYEIAPAYGNLGLVYQTRGELDKAIEMHSQALVINQVLDNKEGIAGNYTNLGEVYRVQGVLFKAIENYQRALRIAKELRLKKVIALNYNNLGIVYSQNDLDEATNMFNQALAINQEIGNKEDIAGNYSNLGNVYRMREELDKAIEMLNNALEINHELDNKEGIACDYGNLGLVYFTRGNFDKAVEMYQKSLAITESLGMKEASANQYGNLGNVYQAYGELDKSIEMYNNSLAIAEKISFTEIKAICYANLGDVYKQKGNKTEAERYYQKAIELFKYIGSPMAETVQSWLDALQ